MTPDEHFYEPAQGHGLRHDPFNAIVAPRPIGWISSRAADGTLNLAPYSFFNAFNYHPPIVGFASIGWKDSVANIEATRQFGWSLATRDLAAAMNASAASIAGDEFALAGLTPAPSRLIDVPRVAEARASFECVLTDIHRLRGRDGAAVDTWLVLGEVVGVHLDRSLIRDGAFDETAAPVILRAGGPASYVEVRPDAFFQMRRPD